MRVVLVVLAAFVVVYVGATVWSVHHHASEPSADHAPRPSVPSLVTFWWLVPAFLKVTPSDLSVGTSLIALPAGGSLAVGVRGATQWYQPKRLLLLELQDPSVASVALSYPPIAPPQTAGAPDPLSASQPQQVIVLPQSGGFVTLTCTSALPCELSL